MKLEYSPSCDKFYQDDFEITRFEAKDLLNFCFITDEILTMNGAMDRVLQFDWDMKRVHDYYGNGD